MPRLFFLLKVHFYLHKSKIFYNFAAEFGRKSVDNGCLFGGKSVNNGCLFGIKSVVLCKEMYMIG